MGGSRQVMVPTARPDIYVSLLGVTLGAILIGCILLALVLRRYDFTITAPKLAGPLASPPVMSLDPAPAPVLRVRT